MSLVYSQHVLLFNSLKCFWVNLFCQFFQALPVWFQNKTCLCLPPKQANGLDQCVVPDLFPITLNMMIFSGEGEAKRKKKKSPRRWNGLEMFHICVSFALLCLICAHMTFWTNGMWAASEKCFSTVAKKENKKKRQNTLQLKRNLCKQVKNTRR